LYCKIEKKNRSDMSKPENLYWSKEIVRTNQGNNFFLIWPFKTCPFEVVQRVSPPIVNLVFPNGKRNSTVSNSLTQFVMNVANAYFACLYCKIEKKNRSDMSKPENLYWSKEIARTNQEMKLFCSKSKSYFWGPSSTFTEHRNKPCCYSV
jgi:hypothetical protein